MKKWYEPQREPEPDGESNEPRGMPSSERRICCVYCNAYAHLTIEEKGPVIVCVLHPKHREHLY